ncbi:MAG: hypothetical protein ABIH23_18075 [bacterium]
MKDSTDHIERIHSDNPRALQIEVIATNRQGHPLRAVHIVPERDEETCERVLIVSGCRESEPSAALQLQEWLVSNEAELIRQRLAVTVVTCADTEETAAVWALAERLAPEIVIGVRSEDGHSGSEFLVTYPYNLSAYSRWTHFLIADRVKLAAEKAGFPQSPTMRFQSGSQDESLSGESGIESLLNRCYGQFGSMAFSIKTNDTNHGADSGLARLKEFLQIGVERFWGEGDTGYPVRIVSSLPPNAVAVCGRNASERRACRLDLWRVRNHLYADPLWPERPGRYQVTLRHGVPYWKPKHGIALRAKFSTRFSPQGILMNGDPAPSGSDRIDHWTHDAAHVIEMARPNCWYGGFAMTIEYERTKS